MACDTDGNHQTGLTEARRGRRRVTAHELQGTREKRLITSIVWWSHEDSTSNYIEQNIRNIHTKYKNTSMITSITNRGQDISVLRLLTGTKNPKLQVSVLCVTYIEIKCATTVS